MKAYPGVGTNVPIYILGSSTDSAYLAASLGFHMYLLHILHQDIWRTAISIYRKHFQPSEYLEQPYMMVCLNVIAAETDEEAAIVGDNDATIFLKCCTKPAKSRYNHLLKIWTNFGIQWKKKCSLLCQV